MALAAPTRPDGPSLAALRRRIEGLADPGGRYRIVCATAGVSPVPVDGLRFIDRPTAAVAADLAVAYRWLLRERDPQTPRYDLLVAEEAQRWCAFENSDPGASDGAIGDADAGGTT